MVGPSLRLARDMGRVGFLEDIGVILAETPSKGDMKSKLVTSYNQAGLPM